MEALWRIASAAGPIACLVLLAGCAPARPATGWRFGEYQLITTPSTDVPTVGGVIGEATRGTSPAAGAPGAIGPPTLQIVGVAAQRPQIAPGETVKLITEYEISGPRASDRSSIAQAFAIAAGRIPVKETHVVRFEGQHVATFERVVSVPRGKASTSVVLKVPVDAAAGFYTVTTIVEPRVATEARSSGSAGSASRNSVFRVGSPLASTPPAAPAVVVADQFKLWADKASYKIGETLKVFFWSSREGYVTLVNLETSGTITILYPNTYSPNHAVKAGQIYSVPGAADPYELRLGGPPGVKLIYALFTTAPTRFIEESFVTSRTFTPVNDKAEEITRDINMAVKKIPLKEQSSAILEIDVAF